MATQTMNINVEGMHCGACATGIQMVTEGMDGVSSAFVDYDKKNGKIEFDSETVTKEAIFAEVKKLGYTLTEVGA
jgi:copper chaperone CopZ